MRTWQYIPKLQEAGHQIEVHELFDDRALASRYKSGKYGIVDRISQATNRIQIAIKRRQFDIVWIEKELMPYLPEPAERLLLSGASYVLDFDDAIHHNYDLNRSALVRHVYSTKIGRLMKHSAGVVAGNSYLAAYARKSGANRIIEIPTVVDIKRYAPRSKIRSAVPEIVWIGSPTTAQYLIRLKPVIEELARRYSFRLHVIGARNLPFSDSLVRYSDWSEENEAALIAESDIGVMPLEDDPWTKGKCGYKLIQYMAVSLPVVASAIGANIDIVKPGGNGFLASTDSEWIRHLECLLLKPELRVSLGKVGRKDVEDTFNLACQAIRLNKFLESTAATSNAA